MPLDPTLEELSGQQWSSDDVRSMTHQPEQPNPAAPYLQGARNTAKKTFVEPLKAIGVLPQQQTPDWYSQAQEAGKQLFQQGPAGMIAGQLPHGGLSQLAVDAGYLPEWISKNPFADFIRSRELGQASQFFTPLIGTLRMARIAPGEKRISSTNFGANDEWSLWSKETGKKLGEMYTNYDKNTNQLKVEYITGLWPEKFDSSINDKRSWGVGTHELQTLGPEVLREYPNIDTLKFTRIGGVFKGNPTTLTYKRVDAPEGPTFVRIKTQRGQSARGWVPPAQRSTPGRPTAQPPSAIPPTAVRPDDPRSEPPYVRPANAAPPYPVEPPPPPPSPPSEGPPQHESWDTMRQRQDAEWATLMQRQDAEWATLMQRLFGR